MAHDDPRGSGEIGPTDAEDFDTVLQPEGHALCHGCLAQGRCRLGVTATERAGDEVLVHVTCASELRGSPGVAHGGWIASVFDESLSQAIHQRQGKIVTKSLEVHYLAPVPVDVPLRVAAVIDHQEGRRFMASAVMRLAGSAQVFATARGIFVVRRRDHFARQHATIPIKTL